MLFKKLSDLLNITYKEANIIIYCMFIPFTWAFMLDIIMHTYLFTTTFIVGLIYLIYRYLKFKFFAIKFYNRLALFLLNFERVGISYKLASIIFCLLAPGLIYTILTILIINQ